MKAITFEQFIDTFNFRDFNEYGNNDEEKFDSKIVRFYLDETCRDWFEFGVYDFGTSSWDIIKRVLNKKIVNSKVMSMTFDSTTGVFKVYLETGDDENKDR